VIAISTLLALTPLFFRVSRAIWINFFVSYDAGAAKAYRKELEEKKKEA
jgi:hypothetical protein